MELEGADFQWLLANTCGLLMLIGFRLQVENTFHNNSLSLTQIISLIIGLTQIIRFFPGKGKHSLVELSLHCRWDPN